MSEDKPNEHVKTVQRAALPELMFAEDVALATRMQAAEADALMRNGNFGRFVFIKGRPCLLRDEFRAHIQGKHDYRGREIT